MKFLCPGAGRVDRMGNMSLDKWVGGLSWCAIYQHPDVFAEHLPRQFRSASCSRRWRQTASDHQLPACHQALAIVPKWQWEKHTELIDQLVQSGRARSNECVCCAISFIDM